MSHNLNAKIDKTAQNDAKGSMLKLRMYGMYKMYNNQKEKSLHSTVLISFEM